MSILNIMKVIIFLIFSISIFANINLDDLNETDVGEISKEFAANFTHTSVGAASANGSVFGLSFGIIGGVTKSPTLDRISKSVDANSDISKIPHGGVFAEVTAPLGFVFETVTVPEVDTSDVAFEHTSMAIRWDISELLTFLPVDLAVRAHISDSYLSYSDTVNNSSTGNVDVNTEIKWASETTGWNVSFGKRLATAEGWIGYGRVESDVAITATNSVSILNFTSDTNFTQKTKGGHFFMGTNVFFMGLKYGIEYSKIMGLDKTTVRLSLSF